MSERTQRRRFVRPTTSGRRRAALVSTAQSCTAVVACTLWVALALPGLHLLPGLGNDGDAGVAISLQSALLGIDDQGSQPANASLRASLRALGIDAHGSLSAALSHTQSEAAYAPLVALVDTPAADGGRCIVAARTDRTDRTARTSERRRTGRARDPAVTAPDCAACSGARACAACPPAGHDPARDGTAGRSASCKPAGPDDRLHVDSACERDGRRADVHRLRNCELGPCRRLQRRLDQCGRLHRRRQRRRTRRRRHVHDRCRSARERGPSRGAAGAAVLLGRKRCGVAQRPVDLVHVAAAARTGRRRPAVRPRRACELRASGHVLHVGGQRRRVRGDGRRPVVRRLRNVPPLRRPAGEQRLPCCAAGPAAAHHQPRQPDDHVHVHAARQHDGGRSGLRRQRDRRLGPSGRLLGRQLERGRLHRRPARRSWPSAPEPV